MIIQRSNLDWGHLNVDGGTLNLDGGTLTLDGGTRPPYNLSTDCNVIEKNCWNNKTIFTIIYPAYGTRMSKIFNALNSRVVFLEMRPTPELEENAGVSSPRCEFQPSKISTKSVHRIAM